MSKSVFAVLAVICEYTVRFSDSRHKMIDKKCDEKEIYEYNRNTMANTMFIIRSVTTVQGQVNVNRKCPSPT